MPTTKTLLVVEDNAITREGLGLVLRREGYDVVLAANGEEALACLRSGPLPDLILLDMFMPAMDGWSFLKLLKAAPPWSPIPVLVMTSAPLTQEWADDHGCRGCLRKPLDVDPLLAEVRRCLSE